MGASKHVLTGDESDDDDDDDDALYAAPPPPVVAYVSIFKFSIKFKFEQPAVCAH